MMLALLCSVSGLTVVYGHGAAVVEGTESSNSELDIFSPLIDISLPLGLEIICFIIGLACVRVFVMESARGRNLPNGSKAKAASRKAAAPACGQAKTAEWATRLSDVLSRRPADYTKECVAQLLLDKRPAQALSKLALMLDIAACAGHLDVAQELLLAAEREAGVCCEAGGLHQLRLLDAAICNKTEKVAELLAKERAESPDGTVSQWSLVVVARGYLKAGEERQALDVLSRVEAARGEAPDHSVALLAEAATNCSKTLEVLKALARGGVALSAEALTQFAEYALRTEHYGLARGIEALIEEQPADLPMSAAEPLLKLWVKVEDSGRARDLFAKLVEAGHLFAESFCRFLIARCAEVPQVDFADQVADHLRSRDAMTLVGYKTLMKVFSTHGYADKACDLYAEINAKGWALDPVTVASLIKLAMQAGRFELIRELRGMVDTSSPSCCKLLIRALGLEGDVEGALEIFRKFIAESQQVDVSAHNMMMDVLVANRDMARACELLDEMTSDGLVPNLITFNTLIKGYCLADDFDGAIGMLDRIEATGMEPDMVSYRSIISWTNKAEDFKRFIFTVRRMETTGVKPDAATLTLILHYLRRCSPEEAKEMLDIIEGMNPPTFDDVSVFNAFMDVCIVHRDQRRLGLLTDGYEKSALDPDVRTYGLLIKANALLRRTQRSLDYWQEMVDSKTVRPNGIALGCVIDALVEAHRVYDALAVFEAWKGTLDCGTIIYSTLIKGFSAVSNVDRALAMYEDMKENNVAFNAVVFSTLINVCAKRGSMKQAERLMMDMLQSGIPANAFTFSSMIRGYTLTKDVESALKIYKSARESGFESNSVIYNNLLDGCIHNQSWQLADSVLSEMSVSDVMSSNYTVSIVIKMWSKRRELDKAFAVLNAVLASGRPIDSHVGACIIGACFHNKAPLRALEVYAEMQTWKNFGGANEQAFSALIGGLTRYGYVKEAVQIATDASYVLKVQPGYDERPLSAAPVKQLFQALARRGLTESVGVPLAQKLREAGTPVRADLL